MHNLINWQSDDNRDCEVNTYMATNLTSQICMCNPIHIDQPFQLYHEIMYSVGYCYSCSAFHSHLKLLTSFAFLGCKLIINFRDIGEYHHYFFNRHYCDNSSTSEDAMVNTKKCPPGRYCLAGLTQEPDATDCSVGRYCPEGKKL